MSNYFENSQWKQARLGRFTSSEIHRLMKSGRKKDQVFGQGALTYIEEKIAEIVTGEAKELEGIKALEWGAANELDAIMLFKEQHDEEVEFFGVGNPEFFQWNSVSGGSPDGLTPTAVVECKCPFVSSNHVGFLIASKLPKSIQADWLKENWENYYCQVQFNMICCKREKAYIISYDPRTVKPEHRLAILEIDADVDFQMEIDHRISEAKKIVKLALETIDECPQVFDPSQITLTKI